MLQRQKPCTKLECDCCVKLVKHTVCKGIWGEKLRDSKLKAYKPLRYLKEEKIQSLYVVFKNNMIFSSVHLNDPEN